MSFFATHFRDKYFPLAYYFEDGYWDADDGYDPLLREVPITYGGVELDDLHEVDQWGAGNLLLGSLHLPHLYARSDMGLATVWLEECAAHVDQAQLQRLPENGWSQQELHRLLDGTRFEAAAIFAAWLGNNTDNAFLDAHPEYPLAEPWNTEAVRLLTNDWRQAELLQNRMSQLSAWLEEDPGPRYTEMLDFIFQREEELEPPPLPPGPGTLAELFREPARDQ